MKIEEKVKHKGIVLDGGMGSMLQNRFFVPSRSIKQKRAFLP